MAAEQLIDRGGKDVKVLVAAEQLSGKGASVVRAVERQSS
jgi:hypothetical protein